MSESNLKDTIVNDVPQNKKISLNGVNGVVENNLGIPECFQRLSFVPENKITSTNGTVYDPRKMLYGLLRKSIFSPAAQKEIETLNLSEEEQLLFRQYKTQRLIRYLRNKRMHQEEFSLKEQELFSKKPSERHTSSEEDNDILTKFFQHYESCKDGTTPCAFESCSEIKEILTCFEKCKAEKNFDCVFCDQEVEYDFWFWKYEELRKKNKMRNWKKRTRLIDDILKHKFQTRRVNCHIEDLFSASSSNGCQDAKAVSDEEKRKKAIKLLLIEHSEICLYRSLYFDEYKCGLSNCRVLSEVVDHINDSSFYQKPCLDKKNCSFAFCSEIDELMTHFSECYKKKNLTCWLCGEYLSRSLDLEKKIDEQTAKFYKEEEEERKQIVKKYPVKKLTWTDKLDKFFYNF